MLQAFGILLAIGVIWLISSCLIYGGFYLLRWIHVIPANLVFTFRGAMDFGEYILLSLLIAAVIMFILDRIGFVDLKTLLPKKKDKK